MYVALAPGESLLPGTRDAIDRIAADPSVEAILLPLVPQGEHALARAARRYLAAWDGRFLHAQNFFAPAARIASRSALPGWRNADAAPALADALDSGRRIEALRSPGAGVGCDIARDLAAWSAHFASQGHAWAQVAARDPRFARFAPAPWWRHNVWQAGRRSVEILQATRHADPLVWILHVQREAAFSRTQPPSEG